MIVCVCVWMWVPFSIREMINFFSKTFIKRTSPGVRQSIQHEGSCVREQQPRDAVRYRHILTTFLCVLCICKEYLCHVYVRRDGLSGIVVADQEYPPRVAFALLNKLIDDYDKEQRGAWKSYAGAPQEWSPLSTAVADYQDPSKADKISAIQKELDETTAVLVRVLLLLSMIWHLPLSC